MRLHVDWTACDGRGLCAELLPELLTEDDWGYPVVRSGARVDAGLADFARMAVQRCPRSALSTVDD
jgi:ferredoxin